jgi:hypothetical protein
MSDGKDTGFPADIFSFGLNTPLDGFRIGTLTTGCAGWRVTEGFSVPGFSAAPLADAVATSIPTAKIVASEQLIRNIDITGNPESQIVSRCFSIVTIGQP